MEINPQIKSTLQQFNIPVDDGVAYLLSVFFDCKPSYTPPLLPQKLNVTNILGLNEQREVVWHIPLFEGDNQDKWNWVKEWNELFGLINKKRKAPDKAVILRMKAFFAENPDVRKEDVIEATKFYFSTVSNAEYLISSHYFISKGVGRDRTSTLEAWVEKYKERIASTPMTKESAQDLSSQMQ